MTLKEAALRLPCLKLDENNNPVLNRKDKYFTQVQGQMAIYNVDQCDFVLCTRNEIFIETVPFESDFWRNLSAKLETFYKSCVAPEIVYPTVKFGYPAVKCDQ